MLDFLYHQCDTKIIVLLQYYYTYAFLFEVSLRFFVLSLLLLIMFLVTFIVTCTESQCYQCMITPITTISRLQTMLTFRAELFTLIFYTLHCSTSWFEPRLFLFCKSFFFKEKNNVEDWKLRNMILRIPAMSLERNLSC